MHLVASTFHVNIMISTVGKSDMRFLETKADSSNSARRRNLAHKHGAASFENCWFKVSIGFPAIYRKAHAPSYASIVLSLRRETIVAVLNLPVFLLEFKMLANCLSHCVKACSDLLRSIR